MESLSNKILLESYEYAKELKLNLDFIELLKDELKKRSLPRDLQNRIK